MKTGTRRWPSGERRSGIAAPVLFRAIIGGPGGALGGRGRAGLFPLNAPRSPIQTRLATANMFSPLALSGLFARYGCAAAQVAPSYLPQILGCLGQNCIGASLFASTFISPRA